MLSPGLDDNCESSDWNRLPSRSSLNSQSASSRSTHAFGDFASATVDRRRDRTFSFGILHRVEVAHGQSVSHHRETLARIICKSLEIIRKMWVIESQLTPPGDGQIGRKSGFSVGHHMFFDKTNSNVVKPAV